LASKCFARFNAPATITAVGCTRDRAHFNDALALPKSTAIPTMSVAVTGLARVHAEKIDCLKL
jgi:hypothetical protein